MTVNFDYTPMAALAKSLIAQFGSKIPCVLVRAVEAAPPDPTMPWRATAPIRFDRFPFIAYTSVLGFPKRSDPITDHDLDILTDGTIQVVPSTNNALVLCGQPTVDDRIEVTQFGVVRVFAVLGVQDITPADITLLFKMRCKAEPALVSGPSQDF